MLLTGRGNLLSMEVRNMRRMVEVMSPDVGIRGRRHPLDHYLELAQFLPSKRPPRQTGNAFAYPSEDRSGLQQGSGQLVNPVAYR